LLIGPSGSGRFVRLVDIHLLILQIAV
jgi:hypothetical protein